MLSYKEYINSKASDYKEYLLDELKSNIKFVNIVNSILFPEQSSIEKWLEMSNVNTFEDYKFTGDQTVRRFCSRKDIDTLPSWIGDKVIFERYTIFSYLECDSYEEAVKKYPSYYYLVQKDFWKKLDGIFFESLCDYKVKKNNLGLYTRAITDNVDLTLSTYREHIDVTGIIGYTCPSLKINIKNEGSISLGRIDIRRLLFMHGNSFSFFYLDSHDHSIDNFQLKIFSRKDDEPVIYEIGNKYVITNSLENIDRYNKYIQTVIELSTYYFRVFEEWLTGILDNRK